MRFPFPLLVADVGGTNVRLGLIRAPGATRIDLEPQRTEAHASLQDAVLAAMQGQPRFPRSMLVCAAGPVEGRCVKLTNASWTIDGTALAGALGLDQGLLFNDFEAQAFSIPSLRPEWLLPIGPAKAGDHGTRLIHGPGTGLGTSALVRAGGRWLAIASEASHSDFAPVAEDEWAFWPHIERPHGRITPEALITGPGLRRLHRARAAGRGAIPLELETPEIIAKALGDRHSDEANTIRVFWRLAARFAGDMALAFVATGGVVLAGGMLPRIVDFLDPVAFRAAFENKAPYVALARRIPVSILMEKDTVLDGMAAIATHPEAYAIEYADRAWGSVTT